MLALPPFRTAFTLPYFMGSPPDALFPVHDRSPAAVLNPAVDGFVPRCPDSSREREHVEHSQAGD
jgi:hypothetical protein